MKRRSIPIVLVIFVIATFVLAGSASADPPKEDFYFKWGDFIGWQDCELRITGGAAHCPGQGYTVEIYSYTNPLVSGTMEWWLDTDNLVKPDEYGWYMQENFQGGWRIQPDGIQGYWEGNLASVGGQFDWYKPISKLEGKGYGALSGYVIKGAHWIEPDEDGNPLYGSIQPANGGVIIPTGLVK